MKNELLKIETSRFIIRTMVLTDITDTYLGWWNDEILQKGFGFKARNWTKKKALEHLLRFDNQSRFHLGIFCKSTQNHIGFISFFIKPEKNCSKLNIMIGDKTYWGSHASTEAAKSITHYLINNLKLSQIIVSVKGDNRSSLALCRRCGYQIREVIENHRFPNGEIDKLIKLDFLRHRVSN